MRDHYSWRRLTKAAERLPPRQQRSSSPKMFIIALAVLTCWLALIGFAQAPDQGASIGVIDSSNLDGILPPVQSRPDAHINIRDWTKRLSEDVQAVGKRTNCLESMEQYFEKHAVEFQTIDPAKVRDNIINQINNLLAQHTAAVNAIVQEAERLAVTHNFVKDLRFNYTDVHRLRNELDPLNASNPIYDPVTGQLVPDISWVGWPNSAGTSGGSGSGGGQVPQFTSINGGTPVPGPPEWQTPVKSIVMQVNKNFGDIPVNTSMSAIHLPLPIYAGLPEIMNGIAWTEKIDAVFKRNLANYMHVHHQYYGDHLGFLRTFPAHRWRIPRNDPDLFDARTRPWYVAGASSPKDVVVLVDTSGSMTGLRREIAKGVVFEILDTLTSNDFFTVMRFSETLTPVGIPKCQNLPSPKIGAALDEQCARPSNANEVEECNRYRRQWEMKSQYLRDHPNVVPGKNGSYMTDDQYFKSIYNVTSDISNAYLLPATSRNIRYLKSNFSMPTAGIANFTHALMGAFELLQSYSRSTRDQAGSQCNQAIMLITDGAIKSHDEIFNRYNYPNAPIRVFTYMIGREVGDITHTKAMACNNRGYYTHVINLGEVREQVQKYLPVMARPMVLSQRHISSWTYAYGDETHQVLTDWVLELKRRERARIMLNEERERFNDLASPGDIISIELTNIPEYDEIPLVDELLKDRVICEFPEDPDEGQSLHDEQDPLGYNDLGCHWTTRRADLLTSVVGPVFDNRNTTLYYQRILRKNIWIEQETHVRNAQLLGVAAVDLRVADIIRTAPSYMLGPNAYTALMGQNGFVMHHPDLRALLEDPFDKQSKILKPYFSSVDLTHVEQVFHKNESDLMRKRAYEEKLLKLREQAAMGQFGSDSFYVKRAVDCRRRLHVRQQTFYYGPIKDTPFSFILALPSSYGLNKPVARMKLDERTATFFQPSDLDVWTVHPEYRYCESQKAYKGNLNSNSQNSSSQTSINLILEIVKSPMELADKIAYEDLSAISTGNERRASTSSSTRIVCDKELFPALLFDAAATYQQPDTFCAPPGPFDNCDRPTSAFSSFYSSRSTARASEESCARTPDELRTTLVKIYGLELSFLATRSGLTRAKVFDSTARIKKLADLFITRHNKAVDEAWYSRTVEWNMRFNEEATIITAPYNAYARLIAKLRQRLTQKVPVANGTRTNCEEVPEENEQAPSTDASSSSIPESGETAGSAGSAQAGVSSAPVSVESTSEDVNSNKSPGNSGASTSVPLASDRSDVYLNDDPVITDQPSNDSMMDLPEINYNKYSSYDFLDLLTNSSVHISATQSVIVNRGTKQHSAVAVTGLLYDYATFARRFLNSTSLQIRTEASNTNGNLETNPIKVELCPNGDCPTRCGYRNDTVDCMLVDNNGFIVVGEELPYIGRSLLDYDEKLMQSLTSRRVFHQVQMVDYQAICTRNNEPVNQQSADQRLALSSPPQSASSSVVSVYKPLQHKQFEWNLMSLFAANLLGSIKHVCSALYSLLLFQTTLTDLADRYLLGEMMHLQRSVVDAQSASVNQSLLALLPNKTYLRPCERTIHLYETRPLDSNKQQHQINNDAPEYYVSKCNCSAWYVYDYVPKTNLIMLIVNTTSACRRCSDSASPSFSAPAAATPLETSQPPVSVAGPPQSQTGFNSGGNGYGNGYSNGGPANKTAEDQVCAMLEREAQLYVKKPETCFSYHTEEAQIHICGGSPKSAPINPSLTATCCALLILLFTKTIGRVTRVDLALN